MTEKLLTPELIGKALSLKAETVRNWLRTGRLKGLRAGPRVWRVRESDLTEFLESKGGPES
jgi:excisionase family DNA binding protein